MILLQIKTDSNNVLRQLDHVLQRRYSSKLFFGPDVVVYHIIIHHSIHTDIESVLVSMIFHISQRYENVPIHTVLLDSIT